MTESKLNPFDAELLVMIGDIAKSQPEVEGKPDRYEITVDTTEIQGNAIEVLKQAVAGRLGKRLLVTHTLDAAVVFNVEYDPTEYPEQIRTRLVEPDATAGTRYCRTLLEVDAIQFRRDNVDAVLRFTGGGTVTTPRTPDGKAMFSFPDGNGIFVNVPESWYIIRELNGRFTARPEKDFKREFEPKNNPVENTQKEPTNKGCGNCANFTNEDVNGNGYCEAVEYTGYNIVEVQQFVGKKLDGDFYDAPNHNATMSITIPTLEGDMKAIPGDYIIKGVKGEFYPCKPDIFKQTYDPAE